MTALPPAAVERLIVAAEQHLADYDRAARSTDKHALESATFLLVVAVDDIRPLVDELRHKVAEADEAHRHHNAATHGEWREKARADALQDEVTRLLALVDQLEAEATRLRVDIAARRVSS